MPNYTLCRIEEVPNVCVCGFQNCKIILLSRSFTSKRRAAYFDVSLKYALGRYKRRFISTIFCPYYGCSLIYLKALCHNFLERLGNTIAVESPTSSPPHKFSCRFRVFAKSTRHYCAWLSSDREHTSLQAPRISTSGKRELVSMKHGSCFMVC